MWFVWEDWSCTRASLLFQHWGQRVGCIKCHGVPLLLKGLVWCALSWDYTMIVIEETELGFTLSMASWKYAQCCFWSLNPLHLQLTCEFTKLHIDTLFYPRRLQTSDFFFLNTLGTLETQLVWHWDQVWSFPIHKEETSLYQRCEK